MECIITTQFGDPTPVRPREITPTENKKEIEIPEEYGGDAKMEEIKNEEDKESEEDDEGGLKGLEICSQRSAESQKDSPM